jgi:MscS family membrane protein
MWLGSVATATGQDLEHPLRPPDRSNPRAALSTFLNDGDALGLYLANEYLPAPSQAKFHRLMALGDATTRALDLSGVPPAARGKAGRAATLALYETLGRIVLPPLESVPGPDSLSGPSGTNLTRWTIPSTEIALVRQENGSRSGDWLFSPETVARAEHDFERVQERPYLRQVPLPKLKEIVTNSGGWMIPYRWVVAWPFWLRTPVLGQAAWKWGALCIVLACVLLLLMPVHRFSLRGTRERPFFQALAQLALPVFVLVATPVVAYLALVQLNLRGGVGSAVELLATAILFITGAWISWRIAPVVAEAIIASPRIAPESVDAHLIRICSRLLGIVTGAGLLAAGADRLGMPLYGIVAGLGVGGLAIALAAQPSIENLIGGLSLFADKAIRVGDHCQCGTDTGMVEAIGIRSTRIRGADRSLTTIPNSTLSKASIVNLSERDRMLMQTMIGLRYETRPDQLRHVLIRIRDLLLGHPRIAPDSVRVRFVGFGASSLDIEIYSYVITRDRPEFLAIREELFLRLMELVEESGTGFAFPSQTLYFARDGGLDTGRTQAAMSQVRQWREEGRFSTLAGDATPSSTATPDPD